MAQHIAQLGTELIEALNSHDVDRVTAFYSADFVGTDIAQAEPQRGPDGIRGALTRYFQAFPDLHFSADNVVVDRDQMVVIWTARGTHQGTLMNIPPTGRVVEVCGMTLIQVHGGQIARSQSVWDLAGMLRAIGLLPEL